MQSLNKKNIKELYDVIIAGGGVAGLNAAMTGGRLGLKILVLEKAVFGGSVAVLEAVSEYPGIERIGGWELTQALANQARDAGCKLIDSIEAVEVVESVDGKFEIRSNDAALRHARAVIVCTGGQPRMLELVEETHFAQRGIHTCAQCAGARYSGQTVAIAGNSSWAVWAAGHLLNLGCTVLYITGDTELRGDASSIKELRGNAEFHFLEGCHITGLYGKEKLEEILVTSLTGGNYEKIAVSAVFVYRGIKPNSSMVSACKDRKGFLEVDEKSMTSLPGVFAAGRVVDADLSIAAMAEKGCQAAHAAESWLRAKA